MICPNDAENVVTQIHWAIRNDSSVSPLHRSGAALWPLSKGRGAVDERGYSLCQPIVGFPANVWCSSGVGCRTKPEDTGYMLPKIPRYMQYSEKLFLNQTARLQRSRQHGCESKLVIQKRTRPMSLLLLNVITSLSKSTNVQGLPEG